MMARRENRHAFKIAAAVVLTVVLSAVPSLAVQTHRFANGITANVFSPGEISDQWTSQDKSGTYLTHPAAGSVELTTSGQVMYPFDEAEVAAALESMQGFSTRVDVDVFILPATPAQTGSSFARRNAIYLAPGTGRVDPSTIAYITAHEMGHVLTWAFVDDYPSRWSSYLQLRGLDQSALATEAMHADRAREILAEDFRALFGGRLATLSGSIENHNLVLPGQVEGLEEMLASFLQGGARQAGPVAGFAFPNPCNPRTTIEMALPAGVQVQQESAVLRIFDIRGALVTTLGGAHLANDHLAVQWDGTARSGEVVSSGRYLYVFTAGQLVAKGSVTLVR